MGLFVELKRRNVFRVGIAYAIAAWVLLQITDVVGEILELPAWGGKLILLILAIGFPLALIFAWAFEMTTEGLKREKDVDRSQSIASQTGKKLDRIITGVLAVAVAYLLFDKLMLEKPQLPAGSPEVQQTARGSAETEAMAEPSIAVLPFVNMSGDPENEYFSDGVAEEILNVLAAVPELKVAARTSAFALKDSTLSIGEIASQLGVNYVLEGSVRKAGDQVRVTAQLIQASDGFHIWSDTYDRQLTNIFAIQDEIAGNIANVLEVRLFGETSSYTTAQDLTPEAYEKYLKARFLMRQRNDEAMEQAITLMNEVLVETPDFPVGLTQLAEALSQQLDSNNSADQRKIQTLVDRALALEPDLAAAHMLNGYVAMGSGNLLTAIRHLERAIELDPSEPRPHHWLGIYLANAGYLSKARESLETAVRLEPDHANANGYLGFVLMLLGDYDRAGYHFEQQERLGNDVGKRRRVYIAALNGKFDAARRLLSTLELNEIDTSRLSLFIDAVVDATAMAEYNAFIETNDIEPWHVTLELMILEQYERAFALEPGRFPRHSWADRWALSRTLPAFNQMTIDTGLPQVWDELGPPPACRKEMDQYDCSPRVKP